MITIMGNTFDASTLMEQYPRGSVERQLLDVMSMSNENYRYDSVDQLKFELQLRKETVDAAWRLYRSGFDFATFHKSKANPEYWDRTPNGGFRLIDGVSPSEAIRDIFKNGNEYATECATAMIIVYYKALLGVFGEALFDEMFPSIYLMNWHMVDPLLQSVGSPRRVKEKLLGDRAYFDNPDVNPKTPEWQGENVIVLPDGLYYGHGVGVGTAGQMIESLNGNRRRGATQPAYLMDAVGRPDFKRLESIYRRSAAQTAHLVWDAFPQPI